MPNSRARFLALDALLARRNIDADERTIKAGRVLVDRRVITNPAARVRIDASVRVLAESRLRGDVKLSCALQQLPVRMLEALEIANGADLVTLVKPTFEVRRGRPPAARADLEAALDAVTAAIDAASWRVMATCESEVTGARGTTESFVHAQRDVVS